MVEVLEEEEGIKYLIRDIPPYLWEKVRVEARVRKVSVRAWLLQAMQNEVNRCKKEREG